jgi:hypothetical protein
MVTDITLYYHETIAIEDGRQTQLRRPLAKQPPRAFCRGDVAAVTDGAYWAISRYEPGNSKVWPADPKPGFRHPLGRPGDYLRAGTRIMRIEAAWIEQLQTISPADILAEGVRPCLYDPDEGAGDFSKVVEGYSMFPGDDSPKLWPTLEFAYEKVWNSRYGDDMFRNNPWVAACRFTLVGDMNEEAHTALDLGNRGLTKRR